MVDNDRPRGEMRQGFEKGRQEQSDARQEITQEITDLRGEFADLRIQFASLSTQLPHAEQLPSVELMTKVKALLEERDEKLKSRKETRSLVKRGVFWLPFALLAAVLGEPVKRWVGLKTGWW